jgi:pimeloyl-ACP methyl ester carboxylesterase
LSVSKGKKAKPGNEEKLVRYSDGLTEAAILYIHGFGACRAEGEMVTDSIGANLKANTYYLRLPGHGTNPEEHANTHFSEYIRESEEALAMMPEIGKRTIVVATSMGGLLATYLAATYPDKIDALILVSPFYDYGQYAGKLVNFPGVVNLISLLDSKGRITYPEEKIKTGEVLPEYPDFWYTEQKYEALFSLEDLKDFAARPEVFKKVTVPALMFYYYKSEEEQDRAASVEAMLQAFSQFGTSKEPRPFNRKVNVINGSHVLFSKYVKVDYELIYNECFRFLDELGF